MADVRLYQWARSVVIAAWRQETGQDPTVFQAQCVQALTRYETKWATTWREPCKDSHNWGSVHATAADEKAGRPSCMYVDHYPDNTPYEQRFRVYVDDIAGCRDVIQHMRAVAGAELDAGRSTDDVWEALFWGRYYGAWCPETIRHFGPAAASHSFSRTGKPATDEAGKACDRECIKMGQDTAASVIQDIAQTLGEEPAPRGGFLDSGSSYDVGGAGWLLALVLGGATLAYAVRRGVAGK